jgi:hypothetical protein
MSLYPRVRNTRQQNVNNVGWTIVGFMGGIIFGFAVCWILF